MPKCQKVRYRDRIAALLVMATTQRKDGSGQPNVEARHTVARQPLRRS